MGLFVKVVDGMLWLYECTMELLLHIVLPILVTLAIWVGILHILLAALYAIISIVGIVSGGYTTTGEVINIIKENLA